jgi:AraC-like DNA-binding protein
MAPASITRISTAAFAARERIPVWREMFGRTIVKLDFEPLSAMPFAAQATVRALPGMGLVSMTSRDLRFRKPPDLIDNDDLVLAIVETGRWNSAQRGREAHLGAGEAVLCSNAETGVGIAAGHRRMIRLPRAALAPLVPDIDAVVLRRIPAEVEALRLLRSYLAALLQEQMLTTPTLQHVAVAHVRDLVAMALGATRDAGEVAEGRGARAARLAAIKADIATNLDHGDVSLGAIALRHQLTPRYIQVLFESEGMTLTEFVLNRRLARAKALLSDELRAFDKIAAIAFDCGFGDLSYFNRAFRRRYGASPSDVRAQAQRRH